MIATSRLPDATPGPAEPAAAASNAGELDPAFYVAQHADLKGLSEADARAHWAAFGEAEGRAPNPERLLAAHRNRARLPADFNIVDYMYVQRDLVFAYPEDWQYLWHYLEYGHDERRAYSSGIVDRDFIRGLHGLPATEDADLPALRRLAAGSGDPATVRLYPSLQHLLVAHGLGPALLARMDFKFYFATNPIGPGRYRERWDAACLRHFCETGLRDLRPVAADLAFDPAFYAELYGRQPLDPAAIARLGRDGAWYRVWLGSPRDVGEAPNARLWLKAKTGADVPSLALLHPATYRNANSDLAALDQDHALAAHIFEHGLYEPRYYVAIDARNAGIFVDLAARMIEATEDSEDAEAPPDLPEDALALPPEELRGRARRILERVAQAAPDYAPATELSAGLLVAEGHLGAALEVYRRAIAGGGAGPETFETAADAATELGNLRGAVHILNTAVARHPGDHSLAELRARAAASYFGEEWNLARAMAWAGRVEDAQERLASASADVTPPARPDAPARPIRSVAILANMDLEQCRFYRVEQKIEHLRAAGYGVSLYEMMKDVARFTDDLCRHEAAIFYRVPANPPIAEAILAARAAGLATFYEIDDLVFDPANFPDPFDDYGGLIGRRDHAELHLGVPLFAAAMRLCDHGIASTPALAAHMAPLCRSGRVFVHRNAFGAKHSAWAERPRKAESDVVTIFYGSGTKAHTGDFATLVEPALERLCAKHGARVRVVLVGHVALTRPDGPLAGRVESRPATWDIEAYWSALSEADINLAVLRRTSFTDAKSEIKWLEAAMLGIPSAVSRTATFANTVEDGVDGFLCGSSADFFAALDRLVSDPALRARVGEAARAKARVGFGIDEMSRNAASIMSAVSPAPSRKPKILVVNVFYPPQAHGGATRVVADNVRDLRALHGDAFDIEVFTSVEGAEEAYRCRAYGEDGIRVVGVTTPPGSDLDPTDERMGAIFERHLAETEPALIHFHCIQRLTASVVEAAIRRNVPYVITVHDAWWISANQFLMDGTGESSTYDYRDPVGTLARQGSRAADRMAAFREPLARAKAVLAVSEPFARTYRRAGIENVSALPNGVSPLPGRVLRKPNDRVVIGHIGGMELHKGYPLLRSALASRPFANLSALVVDGREMHGWARPDSFGSVPVEFIGRVPQDRVHELYGRIDVLAAPSLWEESFGLVTREAIASGCWVVASDRGAIGEPVVEGRNGHVVGVDGVAGLVAALERIDANPTLYTSPPAFRAPLRTAADQANDLAALYRSILAGG